MNPASIIIRRFQRGEENMVSELICRTMPEPTAEHSDYKAKIVISLE